MSGSTLSSIIGKHFPEVDIDQVTQYIQESHGLKNPEARLPKNGNETSMERATAAILLQKIRKITQHSSDILDLSSPKWQEDFVNAVRSEDALENWLGWMVTQSQLKSDIVDKKGRFEALFNANPHGVSVVKNRTILNANPAFYKLFGFSPEEVIGKSTRITYPSDKDYHEAGEVIYSQLAKGENYVGIIRYKRKGKDEIFYAEISGGYINPKNPDEGAIFVYADKTEQIKAEKHTNYLINYDTLTNLPNERTIKDELGKRIKKAHELEGSENPFSFATIFLGIDGLSTINETADHSVWDAILKQAAIRLKECLREQDFIGRFQSGGKFVIILDDIHKQGQSEAVINRIRESFAREFTIDNDKNNRAYLEVHIGVDVYPQNGSTVEEILRHTDIAMQNSRKHRKPYVYYDAKMSSEIEYQALLQHHLHDALKKKEFSLAYQIKVDAQTHMIRGMEALIRWKNPVLGNVSPMNFIPLAEEKRYIIDIGEWVLNESCRQLVELQNQGYSNISVSVNVSAVQLTDPEFVSKVQKALKKSGLSPSHLVLELTETAIIESREAALSVLNKLSHLGICISIDDFGTGQSSLTYLAHYPVREIKIDRSFIVKLTHASDIVEQDKNNVLVDLIISMAKKLNFKIVAEWVENEEQISKLRSQWVDEFQWYFYSKPQEIDGLNEVLLNFDKNKIS